MRILIVNQGVIPVTYYGGTERVVWYLGKELAEMGHEVTYLVKEGSHSNFSKVLHIDRNKKITEQLPSNIDIIHFHYLPENPEKIKIPYIITIHGNVNNTDKLDRNVVFVSKNHANRHGSDCYVYNGLDWEDYSKPDLFCSRTYFHFLGKAAWRVKNVKGAIDMISKLSGGKLKVLGGVRFNFNMGLRLTFSPKVKFYGMVGGKEKDALLNHSKGLIFPVRWNEPFGLAIIESLFYGCPIFGTPYGSLPELVKKDFGYLSKNKLELVEALKNADAYSRKNCHEYAREHFNSKKMAASYLLKYEKVLSNEKLNNSSPILQEKQKTKFLDWV